MRLFDRIVDKIEKVEVLFLAFCFLLMLFLAFLQVVMRNFFNAGIPWADSIVKLMVLWVGFLGAIVATKIDQHLTLEVLTKYLPERFKGHCTFVTRIFAIIICYFLFMASVKFLKSEASTGEEFLGLFPHWWTLTIIPATFAMMAFHFLANIARQLMPPADGEYK